MKGNNCVWREGKESKTIVVPEWERGKKKGQNLNGCKKVIEVLCGKNLGKGILCVVKMANIGMDLSF